MRVQGTEENIVGTEEEIEQTVTEVKIASPVSHNTIVDEKKQCWIGKYIVRSPIGNCAISGMKVTPVTSFQPLESIIPKRMLRQGWREKMR